MNTTNTEARKILLRKYTFEVLPKYNGEYWGECGVSPLQPTRECGELRKLSQWGLEQSSIRKSIWWILDSENVSGNKE